MKGMIGMMGMKGMKGAMETPGSCTEAQDWNLGDGTGGTEIHVGTANNRTDCVAKCCSLYPNANGATVPSACTSNCACYCEFNMSGRFGSSYNSTYIRPWALRGSARLAIGNASLKATEDGNINEDDPHKPLEEDPKKLLEEDPKKLQAEE